MPEDMTPLVAALVGVSPAPARLDRDALMYAAGRAATRRSWLWPAVAAGFALVTVGLGVRLATVEPRIVEKVVFVRDSVPESMPYPSSGYDVDETRYDALLRRTSPLGDLPSPTGARAPAGADTGPLPPSLERELDFPPGSLRNVGPRTVPVSPTPR